MRDVLVTDRGGVLELELQNPEQGAADKRAKKKKENEIQNQINNFLSNAIVPVSIFSDQIPEKKLRRQRLEAQTSWLWRALAGMSLLPLSQSSRGSQVLSDPIQSRNIDIKMG